MFPRGEDGWHPNIPIQNKEISEISDNDEANISSKCISTMNYFAYWLQIGRSNEAITLHYYGRLFQQWIVDMYTVIEQTRLNYLRFNQKQIQSALDIANPWYNKIFAKHVTFNQSNALKISHYSEVTNQIA